jgi:putative transposase
MILDDASAKMEEGRRDYNEVRSHSVLGNNMLISLMDSSVASLSA